MRKYELYVNQILENIEKIENSLKGVKKENFKKNGDLIDMTLMRVQIIGENAKGIPVNLKKKYPKIKWEKILVSRNIISHKYSKVNLDIVWDLIKNEFPELYKLVEEIKEDIENE